MPDSSAIDAALIAKLLNDATLMAITTDGVWFDEAAQDSTKFVVVSFANGHDEEQFGGRSHEEGLYLVKAVILSASSASARAAAARIDALLDGGTLTIAGYSLMVMQRQGRVEKTEVDEIDKSIRWQHHGGFYQIMASPN